MFSPLLHPSLASLVFVERIQTSKFINDHDENNKVGLPPAWFDAGRNSVGQFSGTPAVKLGLRPNLAPAPITKATGNRMTTTIVKTPMLGGDAMWEKLSHDEGNVVSERDAPVLNLCMLNGTADRLGPEPHRRPLFLLFRTAPAHSRSVFSFRRRVKRLIG